MNTSKESKENNEHDDFINPMITNSIHSQLDIEDSKKKDINPNERVLSTQFNMILFTFYACFVMIGTSALSNIGYIVYFNVYGISLNSIEVIGTVGTLTRLITQIAVGYWGDILIFGKYGKRKPLILLGYIGQVVSVFFLILWSYSFILVIHMD